ncbi:MAG: B12-binding domain-containing protein [Phycisphaerae bacterium]
MARAIGVSDASLKRWCDKGVITSIRTVGGHRRLPLDAVVKFLRDSGHCLIRPEILGLPSTTGTGKTVRDRAAEQFRESLESGDEERAHRICVDLHLARQPMFEILDQVVTPALQSVGDRWRHGEIDVFQERRGVEICTRLMHVFREMLPAPQPGSPHAIGAAIEGDPYSLPTLMAELTLREAGWRADSLGIGLPPESLIAALHMYRPRLVWLSASTLTDAARFAAQVDELYAAATEYRAALVLGGRALTDTVRAKLRFTVFCERVTHLRSFADALHSSSPPVDAIGGASTDA